MHKRSKISLVFFVLLVLSVLLFVLSKIGLLNGPQSISAKILSPFQSLSFSAFNSLSNSSDLRIKRLEEQNKELLGKLVNQDKLTRENAALHDQFQTSFPKSTALLPARIVGAPSFIPGVTDPSTFIIDKGLRDKVKNGAAVVFKNILVGKVVSSSDYFSKVDLIISPTFALTVKDQRSGATGVVKGDGGRKLILNNVIQSQEIKTSDILVTKGDQKADGTGFPPDLIVGEIVSVEKKPSAVFQKGEAESPLDFSSLSTVFVVVY